MPAAGDLRERHPDKRGWIAAWICGLALLLCVLATDPRLEMGLHDDWSYIYSAMVLAKTGHVVYNGWATAMLGWQLYLGALFIKLFGFSFTAVRASTMLVAVVTVPLVHRLLVRLGVPVWNATLGTLTFALSPLYLPLAASYMSDIPALFCLLVCMYGCVRAMGAETDRRACGWLVFAAATNATGGTVRQIAWLGVLVMVPSVAWYLRRRRGVVVTGAVMWAVSLAAVFGLLHWFNHQPYVSVEKLLPVGMDVHDAVRIAKDMVKAVFTMALLLLPVVTAFALRFPLRDRVARRVLVIVLAAMVAGVGVLSWHGGGARWMSLLLGDYVSAKGILDLGWMLGTLPDVVPKPVGAVVALAVFVAGVMSAGWFCFAKVTRERAAVVWESPVFWLLGPFSVAYVGLIVTRAAMFDRYLLPLLFALLVVLLRLYERRVGGRLPLACAVPLVVLAVYGVAGTHDLFALSRARLAAANEMRAAGVPRNEIVAGFEYDGWTQIELTGYVNEPRMHTPAGAYRPWQAPIGAAAGCLPAFASYTPSIHARYFLATAAGVCYPASEFGPVSYRSWLPRRDPAVYIVRAP